MFKGTGYEGVSWIFLGRGQLQDPVKYGNEPLGFVKGGEFLE
jgi:hypothetical protein